MNNRELVLSAHTTLFDARDTSVLDTAFHPDFIEHSPLVAGGAAGLATLVDEAGEALSYTNVRVLADADLVALHGRYTGLDDTDLIGFDLYRVADGLLIEHWDGLVPVAAPNASGRTQLDGPTDTSTGDPEANRALVTEFFTAALINGDYEAFRTYTDGVHLTQHSPDIADGVDNVITFLEELRDSGQGLVYDRIHRTVADGPFVLTQSEGSIAGQRHSYHELWRVDNGRIVELWDAITPIPSDAEAVHTYGLF
ncbi:nuclear transport factor 2 family protein [Corynebacterium pacaense]|uniref:nuclear transport factor 2 family protein n=1 Tax=Corynebacterium pacaense TaxID=1816684 RepID=UPI0009B9EAFD|nr:nuclear transport factor 2 family protein [Corynebacterium pacaense]